MNNLIDRRLKHRAKIVEITTFIIIKIKMYYDTYHMSLLLQSNNKTYLRLHYKYQSFEKLNRKLFSQRCESFFVKCRVDCLTYELKLLSIWKIYSIVFIAQLKSAFIENLYRRSQFEHSNSVKLKENTERWKFYEIKKIMKKRTRKYDNYLIT